MSASSGKAVARPSQFSGQRQYTLSDMRNKFKAIEKFDQETVQYVLQQMEEDFFIQKAHEMHATEQWIRWLCRIKGSKPHKEVDIRQLARFALFKDWQRPPHSKAGRDVKHGPTKRLPPMIESAASPALESRAPQKGTGNSPGTG